MADQTIPDYETIRAAVTGETWAVEKVLMCYKDEIDRQATVRNVNRTEHSNWKLMKICASISQ